MFGSMSTWSMMSLSIWTTPSSRRRVRPLPLRGHDQNARVFHLQVLFDKNEQQAGRLVHHENRVLAVLVGHAQVVADLQAELAVIGGAANVVEMRVRKVDVAAAVLVALVHAGVLLVQLLHQVSVRHSLAVPVLLPVRSEEHTSELQS